MNAEMEISDYNGEEFKKKIENLIRELDSSARLTKFKMRKKHGTDYSTWNDEKDIDWEEEYDEL